MSGTASFDASLRPRPLEASGSLSVVTLRLAADTTPEATDALVDAWRAMSPVERALIADQLSVDVTALAKAGIRAQNPGISDVDLLHELARRRYGSALADAAYGRSGD